MEVVTFLLGQLVRFAIFLAITLAVVFPFYYAVLSSGDRGDDRSATALFWRVMFWIVVALIVFIAVFPFYYAVLSSLESGTALFRPNLLPAEVTTQNYETVLGARSFVRSVVNSVFIAGTTVVAALFLAVTASYALARVRFRGRGLLLMTILGVSMFPQIAVLSGLFELVNWLGVYNTPWALIISYTIFTLPFTVWVLTTFMRDLPVEIEEAAIVDGASPWVIISRVFLPLLWPALVTTGLLAFIGAWNEFLFALTFTVSETQRTVPVAIALLSGASSQEIPWGPIMAASVLVTVPLIVLVLVFQRKIVAGLTAGGVKG
jgi:trehalose/maltose transport system permease protein